MLDIGSAIGFRCGDLALSQRRYASASSAVPNSDPTGDGSFMRKKIVAGG
jgi:hypothetical protein